MFKYERLKREDAEFRLARFIHHVDSQEPDPIRLELRHVPMRTPNICYRALSYVWGDATKDAVEIEINGCPFAIGQNLHRGLLQVRQSSGTDRSWLWVDSICIDQSDPEEKSWQVTVMRDIFSSAKLVYISLGAGSVDSDRAMDFLARVGPEAAAAWPIGRGLGHRQTEYLINFLTAPAPQEHTKENMGGYDPDYAMARFIYSLLREEGLQPIDTNPVRPGELCAGLVDILVRDYWHRIWVIQEVTLAKEGLILCGEKSVTLRAFETVIDAIFYCLQSGILRRRGRPEYLNFAHGLASNQNKIIALSMRWRCHFSRGDALRLGEVLHQTQPAPGRPFYSATDPRDIIFALLGIVEDRKRVRVEVDYTSSVAEVFARATLSLIRDGDRWPWPFTLDCCIPRSRARHEDDLPSWVPDWREIGKHGCTIQSINNGTGFCATTGKPPPAREEEIVDPTVLQHPGCRVDVITEVMEPAKCLEHSNLQELPDIGCVNAWLSSVCDFAGLGDEPGPDEDYVWRTVMLDRPDGVNGAYRPKGPQSLPERDRRLIRTIMRRQPLDADELRDNGAEFVSSCFGGEEPWNAVTIEKQLAFLTEQWPRFVAHLRRGRTLFKTQRGMFGFGHAVIRPGDVATLLWGVRSPIILRPRSCGGDGFFFVGDAYVDGIMYGEFLATDPDEELFCIW